MIRPGERMAWEDLIACGLVVGIGLFASYNDCVESDWWGLCGHVLMVVIFGLLSAMRIYHLTHKDEVFGEKE